MIDTILYIILIILGVALFVILSVCAIAPMFISKRETGGKQPLVKLSEGRGSR